MKLLGNLADEPMEERDFVFSKGHTWDESQSNRPGYRVRYEDGYTSWPLKGTFERAYRKMILKEAEMVAGGQFVIPDSRDQRLAWHSQRDKIEDSKNSDARSENFLLSDP